ncbi:hypothetical protein ACFWPX_12615 [Nocardia sp. NPDC058518]|uniref:hypothetical protein n=1 Tax=Nocardia sp. NPDC058518 TaxID=3346534 RepID=UPI003657426F
MSEGAAEDVDERAGRGPAAQVRHCDYLPTRAGTASGITPGLTVSIGGLATPLIGGIADGTSLRTALTRWSLCPP